MYIHGARNLGTAWLGVLAQGVSPEAVVQLMAKAAAI